MNPAEALADRLYTTEDPISSADRRRLSRLLSAVASSYRFSKDAPADDVSGNAAWSTVAAEFAQDFAHDVTGDLT